MRKMKSAFDKEFTKLTVISVIVALVIVVVPCLFYVFLNALTAVLALVILLAMVPLYISLKKHRISDIEKYISTRNSIIRQKLIELNGFVLSISPDITCQIEVGSFTPKYFYKKPGSLMSQQVIDFNTKGTTICIGTVFKGFFDTFSQKLSECKNNGIDEIYIEKEDAIDYELIRSIVSHNIEQYNVMNEHFVSAPDNDITAQK